MKTSRLLLAALGALFSASIWAANPIRISVSPAPAAQTNAVQETASVVRGGVYTSKDDVSAYIWAFGCLPTNFITKAEARRLGWSGGPLEPYAHGKSIGGDHFGNYERKLPPGRYRECDIDTRGRPRGAKRIIFSQDRRIYYTGDHYRTFERLNRKPERNPNK